MRGQRLWAYFGEEGHVKKGGHIREERLLTVHTLW